MADKKTYTGLSKNYATVPAFSITTIDYLDTKPNYFRVQNRGNTEIYCSTNNMPTTKHYDFAVAGKKMKMFAEPYNRTRLYIFNPSGSDVEVAVLSFQAEFEPLTLALSEIEVEMPKEFETSMAITSFNAPLPTGNNKIGKVEITNDSLPAGNNMIGKVEVVGGVSGEAVVAIHNYVENIAQLINGLVSNTTSSNYVGLANVMSELGYLTMSANLTSNIDVTEKKNINQDTIIYNSVVFNVITIHTIKNDGDTDLMLEFVDTDPNTSKNFTLKAGESINNLKFIGLKLAVKGNNYSFRSITSYREA